MENILALYQQNYSLVGWIPEVCVILLITAVVYVVQKLFVATISKRTHIQHNLYLNSLLSAVSLPISLLVWLTGFILVAISIREFFTTIDGFNWLESGLRVELILIIGWVLQRLITRLEYNLVNPVDNRKPIDTTTALAVSRLATIVLVVAIILIVLQTLDIDVSGVITIGSAGTLIIGFAAKDMLANFFGGLMIFTEQPFKVGDWIRSPDKDIEGHVEHIGWRVTRIRTLEKRPLYVQNGIFLNISIENASRMTNRRIKETIGLRYSDIHKVPAITIAIEQMLKQDPNIDTNQTMFVALCNFAEGALDCQVYCFTKATDSGEFMRLQQDIFLKIADIVAQHGASMDCPARTLLVPEGMLAQS